MKVSNQCYFSIDVLLGTNEFLKPKFLDNCLVNASPLPSKPCIAPTAPPKLSVKILLSASLNFLSNLIKLSIHPETLKPNDIGIAFYPIVLPIIGVSAYKFEN